MGRSISATLQRQVTVIWRRVALSRVLRLTVPAAGIAAFVWVALRILASVQLVAVDQLGTFAGVLAGIVVLVAAAAFASTRVPTAQAVRELDRRAGAQGRLIAAWELTDRSDAFSRAAVEDATRWLQAHPPASGRLFTPQWPAQTSRVLVLLALVPVSAWLLRDLVLELPSRSHRARVARQMEESNAEKLLASAKELELPTLEWTLDELEEYRPPKPPHPKVTTEPTREKESAQVDQQGELDDPSALLDPEARAFLAALTSPEMRRRITQEIGTNYTGEQAPAQFERFDAIAQMARDPNLSGEQIIKGDPDAGSDRLELDMPMMDASGDIGLKVNPDDFKHDYMIDQNAVSEMVGAIKESFSQYLNEFAQQVLDGLEDGLKEGLVEQQTQHLSRPLKDNPYGLGDLESMSTSDEGPIVAAKGDGTPTAYAEGMTQSVGGTAKGGVGAGRGDGKGEGSEAGAHVNQPAEGPRLDLHGSLDERLAVVDMIQKMSGSSTLEVDDTALAEVVRQISKEAEVEAMAAEDIPPDYRDAVTRYFRNLQE